MFFILNYIPKHGNKLWIACWLIVMLSFVWCYGNMYRQDTYCKTLTYCPKGQVSIGLGIDYCICSFQPK